MCGSTVRQYRKDRRWANSSFVCFAWQKTFTPQSSKQAVSRNMILFSRVPIFDKSGSQSLILGIEIRKNEGELRHGREEVWCSFYPLLL